MSKTLFKQQFLFSSTLILLFLLHVVATHASHAEPTANAELIEKTKALTRSTGQPSPAINIKKLSVTEQSKNAPNAYTILTQTKHDQTAFTQGFDLENGRFYESSGLYGRSYIETYNNEKRISKKNLPRNIFAEGLVNIDEEIFLITWQRGKLFVFDAHDLSLKREKKYTGEGWGLTYNGKQLIMSNGSSSLFFRDKNTFEIERTINVRDKKKSYSRLNELEYAKGYIWANIWQSSYIIKIRSFDGYVVEQYDLSKLVKENSTRPGHTVLNGIAYSENEDAFWVTGKFWPKRYLIKFHD